MEQLGTDAQVVNGKTTYYAWYEMYPAGVVMINSITVNPGDTITASVSYSKGVFTLSLTDGSQPVFSINKSDPSAARSSAEWIEEAPSSGSGVIPLADFGTVSFSNASATVGGQTAAINGFTDKTYQVDMITQADVLKATTSSLNSSGTGFTVTWDSSGPIGGSGGKRGPEMQDPVAYSINLYNPIASTPNSQSSSFSTSAGLPVSSGVSSSSWVPNATPRQTFYSSPEIAEVSADQIRKSIDSSVSPAIQDIWLGKPMHGDLPQSPLKVDDIMGNGALNSYLVEDGEIMRDFEGSRPSLTSAADRQDSAFPALGGFFGMVFLTGSMKPPAKKSSERRINPEE